MLIAKVVNKSYLLLVSNLIEGVVHTLFVDNCHCDSVMQGTGEETTGGALQQAENAGIKSWPPRAPADMPGTLSIDIN